jgi:hypothetical protein
MSSTTVDAVLVNAVQDAPVPTTPDTEPAPSTDTQSEPTPSTDSSEGTSSGASVEEVLMFVTSDDGAEQLGRACDTFRHRMCQVAAIHFAAMVFFWHAVDKVANYADEGLRHAAAAVHARLQSLDNEELGAVVFYVMSMVTVLSLGLMWGERRGG